MFKLSSLLFCGAIASSSLCVSTQAGIFSHDRFLAAETAAPAAAGDDWEEFGLIQTTEDEKEEAVWSWFAKAWAALLKKYDGSEEQAYEHLNQLGCASSNDASDMLELYNAFTEHFKLPNFAPSAETCTVIKKNDTNTTTPTPTPTPTPVVTNGTTNNNNTNTTTSPTPTPTPTPSRTSNPNNQGGDSDFIQVVIQIDFSKEKQSLDKTKTSVNSTINQPEVGFTKKDSENKTPVPVPTSDIKTDKTAETTFGKPDEVVKTITTGAPATDKPSAKQIGDKKPSPKPSSATPSTTAPVPSAKPIKPSSDTNPKKKCDSQ